MVLNNRYLELSLIVHYWGHLWPLLPPPPPKREKILICHHILAAGLVVASPCTCYPP